MPPTTQQEMKTAINMLLGPIAQFEKAWKTIASPDRPVSQKRIEANQRLEAAHGLKTMSGLGAAVSVFFVFVTLIIFLIGGAKPAAVTGILVVVCFGVSMWLAHRYHLAFIHAVNIYRTGVLEDSPKLQELFRILNGDLTEEEWKTEMAKCQYPEDGVEFDDACPTKQEDATRREPVGRVHRGDDHGREAHAQAGHEESSCG